MNYTYLFSQEINSISVMVVTLSDHIHAKGILSLATDHSGADSKTVYCCSSDETFGVWTCSDSGELAVDVQTTANNCQGVLAVYGEEVYLAETSQDVKTGIDQHGLVRYGLSAFLPSLPLLTFSLEITAVACDGTYLIAGSNDFIVKWTKLNEQNDSSKTSKIDRFECDGIVTSISISPDGDHYALSTSDGYAQVRLFSKVAKKPLARFKVCEPFSHIRDESPRIQCCWHPSGNHLYIPAKGGIVVVDCETLDDCETWEKKQILTASGAAHELFSVAVMSSSSQAHNNSSVFLAASTVEGTVAVWKCSGTAAQFHLLEVKKNIKTNLGTITSLLFNPKNKDVLLVAYSEGYICSVTDMLKKANDEQIQNTQNGNAFIDDAATETSRPASAALQERMGSAAEMDLDDIENDLGLIKAQFGFNSNQANEQQIDTSINRNFPLHLPAVNAEPCTTLKGMQVPRSFAVSSTPSTEEGRYLAWNSYGIIKSYSNADDEGSTIEVNFHDSTVHHEIIIDNTATNYVLGDINADLVALASKRNLAKESELNVHHVSSWDHDSRKWSQTMDNGEVIECLCVGRDFVAVHTTLRYLRVFTVAGTQRYIVSLPGALLTICAQGSKLATASATGAVIIQSDDDYEHQLIANIYEVNALSGECAPRLESTLPLALSAYSSLSWMQFSAAGNLVTMDSDCLVRLYLPQRAVWIPVLVGADLLKDPDGADHIWPIALIDLPGRAHFRYIYCRNAKHPPVNKSSIAPSKVDLRLPVVDPTSEKSKLEAELMAIELQQVIARQRTDLAPEQAKEVAALTQNYVVSLLKLFSVSCQMNRENRAAEMANRATNSQLVQGLCNYASKARRPNLSDKVAAIGRERLKAIENEKQQQQMSQRRQQQPHMASAAPPTTATHNFNQPIQQVAPSSNNDSPVIAPPRLLMAKRKAPPQFGLLAASSSSSSSNFMSTKTIIEEAEATLKSGRKITITKALPKAPEKENEEVVEMDFDELASIDDGESELNTSIGSSMLDSSMCLDTSHSNNPFKKVKKTPTTVGPNRGFAEKKDEDEGIPDFFDALSSTGKKHKN